MVVQRKCAILFARLWRYAGDAARPKVMSLAGWGRYLWEGGVAPLGSGLIDHSQNATAAAMQMAEKKAWAHRS